MYHFCAYIYPINNEQRIMKTQHTPGPWYEYDMGWSGQTAIAVKHANSNFLIVPAMNKGANARLIAAAPELLEAAQIALSEIEMKNAHFGMRTSTATEALRAALSKATGTK